LISSLTCLRAARLARPRYPRSARIAWTPGQFGQVVGQQIAPDLDVVWLRSHGQRM
jgi:hypothetical protein